MGVWCPQPKVNNNNKRFVPVLEPVLCLLKREYQMSTNCYQTVLMNKHLNACLSRTCWTRGRWCPSPLPLCSFGCELPDVRLINTHQDVFWLDVCVDDLTLCVQIVQTLEYLENECVKTFIKGKCLNLFETKISRYKGVDSFLIASRGRGFSGNIGHNYWIFRSITKAPWLKKCKHFTIFLLQEAC